MAMRKARKLPKTCREPKLRADLWKAVFEYENSLTMLSEKSGVAMPVIFRFLRGERDLRVETAGRLCEVLGLELTKRKP